MDSPAPKATGSKPPVISGAVPPVIKPPVIPGPKPSEKSAGAGHQANSRAARRVSFNGTILTPEQLLGIDAMCQKHFADGDYWYDKVCGIWGYKGGTCRGRMPAGLELCGPLSPDASEGTTGVFVNGRQLGRVELAFLQQVVMVFAGRYWLDASGNIGAEGCPTMGNLWAGAAGWFARICAYSGGGAGNSGGGSAGRYSSTGAVMSDGQGFVGYIDSEGRSAST